VSAKWANPNLGLAADSNGELYTIQNNVLAPLPINFRVSGQSSYDIADNGQIYVTDGNNVYTGSVSGNFTKIFSAGGVSGGLSLSAYTNKVAIIEGGIVQFQADEGGNKNRKQTTNTVIVVSTSGQIMAQKKMIANSASWSPNGDHLLVNGPSTTTILTDSLSTVVSPTINNATLYTWSSTNDNLLFYSIDSQLWSYNIQTGQSQKLAALAAGESVTGIYPNSDDSYIYFTDDNTEKTQLFKVGLQGQPVDTSLTSLSIFMPETLSSCVLNFINFVKPTILVGYSQGTSTDQCSTVAQSEVGYYGINTNNLQYQFIPEDANE
jgi:hypothetical protein